MVQAEHRGRAPHRGKADLVVAVLLTVAALAIVTVLWRYGDARATTSTTAANEPSPLATPTALPPSLGEIWQAASKATPVPVIADPTVLPADRGGTVADPTVITGDGSEVVGRDPLTGQVRWRYARDLPLCTVASAWGNALAVYSKDPAYCSEVTALDGGTGRRVTQRNGDAEAGTRVLFDGTHATAVGSQYLETWRSDLVKTLQFGKVPAPVNPGKQPRTGCAFGSIAVAVNLIGLIERCPTEDSDRLTVLKANPKEWELPEVNFSVLIGARGARVVAVSAERVALLLPGPARLVSYDNAGNQVGVHPIDLTPPTATERVEVPATTVTPDAVYWFTGTSTVALNPTDFTPLWTFQGSLGAGTLFAGRLLVPAPNELAVLDPRTGARIGSTPVDRGSYQGPVQLAAAGPVVLEQRGDLLVALR